MKITLLLILIALLQYLYFIGQTGLARTKYGVNAPKTTGHEVWERIFRVQQNTMEQLIIFIPGMVIFSQTVSPMWGVIPGVTYIVGRQLYAYSYIKDPKSRGPGAIMSIMSNVVLVVGSAIGLLINWTVL